MGVLREELNLLFRDKMYTCKYKVLLLLLLLLLLQYAHLAKVMLLTYLSLA